MAGKSLVISITENELNKIDDIPHYISNKNERRSLDDEIVFELNSKKIIEQENLKVFPAQFTLRENTQEYLALEVTNQCDMGCSHCFNILDRNGHKSYMSTETAENITNLMGNNSRPVDRVVCLTGGEPTFNIGSLVEISNIFSALEGTVIHIATNGTGFPLNRRELGDFFDRFNDNVYWQISYDAYHNPWFEKLIGKKVAKSLNNEYAEDDPTLAVIIYVTEVLNQKGKKLGVRVSTNPKNKEEGNFYENKAKKALGIPLEDGFNDRAKVYSSLMAYDSKGNILIDPTTYAGSRAKEVCSQGQELYIDFKGKIWPSMLWKSAKENYLGRLVKLEKISDDSKIIKEEYVEATK